VFFSLVVCVLFFLNTAISVGKFVLASSTEVKFPHTGLFCSWRVLRECFSEGKRACPGKNLILSGNSSGNYIVPPLKCICSHSRMFCRL